MLKEKTSLQSLPSEYWILVNGAGEDKAKTECTATAKVDNTGTAKGSMSCVDPSSETRYEASVEYNSRTGRTSGEVSVT